MQYEHRPLYEQLEKGTVLLRAEESDYRQFDDSSYQRYAVKQLLWQYNVQASRNTKVTSNVLLCGYVGVCLCTGTKT